MNLNHGHVTPNPDGSKARCGGPGICPQCSAEMAQANKAQLAIETHRADAATEMWKMAAERLRRQESVNLSLTEKLEQAVKWAKNSDALYKDMALQRNDALEHAQQLEAKLARAMAAMAEELKESVRHENEAIALRAKLAALKGTTEDEWMEIRNRLLAERDDLRAKLAEVQDEQRTNLAETLRLGAERDDLRAKLAAAEARVAELQAWLENLMKCRNEYVAEMERLGAAAHVRQGELDAARTKLAAAEAGIAERDANENAHVHALEEKP